MAEPRNLDRVIGARVVATLRGPGDVTGLQLRDEAGNIYQTLEYDADGRPRPGLVQLVPLAGLPAGGSVSVLAPEVKRLPAPRQGPPRAEPPRLEAPKAPEALAQEQRHRRNSKGIRPGEVIGLCAECGKEVRHDYYTYLKPGQPVYCSKQCRSPSLRRIAQARARASPPPTPPPEPEQLAVQHAHQWSIDAAHGWLATCQVPGCGATKPMPPDERSAWNKFPGEHNVSRGR